MLSQNAKTFLCCGKPAKQQNSEISKLSDGFKLGKVKNLVAMDRTQVPQSPSPQAEKAHLRLAAGTKVLACQPWKKPCSFILTARWSQEIVSGVAVGCLLEGVSIVVFTGIIVVCFIVGCV